MAIEQTQTMDQKIPSPEEIKKSPIKFTPEEIEEIKSFQNEMNNLVYSLGQLSLSKIRIEEQESSIKMAMSELRLREKEQADKLTKKYGQGQLDIETGAFIPAE